MQKKTVKRFAAVAAFTGTATAVAASTLLHPGHAVTQPRLLFSAKAAPAPAVAGAYTLDTVHTSVGFEIRHLGLNSIQGRFNTFSGKIVADPKDLSKSGVTFTAQIASIDTAVAPRDTSLRSPAFFDAEKHPELTFRSTRVRRKGNGYVAEGPLTIKGVSRTVTIPFRYHGPLQDPWGSTRIGIVCDPITIKRSDYGIGAQDKLPNGTPMLGDEVTIRLSVQASLDKPDAQ